PGLTRRRPVHRDRPDHGRRGRMRGTRPGAVPAAGGDGRRRLVGAHARDRGRAAGVPARGSRGMKVAVVGAGAWGTAVAALGSVNADVVLWARRPELASCISATHENGDYLPGIALPDAVAATPDLPVACRGADVVVMAVPSHGFRGVLTEAAATIGAD